MSLPALARPSSGHANVPTHNRDEYQSLDLSLGLNSSIGTHRASLSSLTSLSPLPKADISCDGIVTETRPERPRSTDLKYSYSKSQMRRGTDEDGAKNCDTSIVREAQVDGATVGYYGSEQTLINRELKQGIVDIESIIEGMHISQIERCVVMKGDMGKVHEQCIRKVDGYQREMQWGVSLGYGIEELCEQLSLAITPGAISALGEPPKIPALYSLVPLLNEMLASELRSIRLDQVCNQLSGMIDPLTNGHFDLIGPITQMMKLVHTDVLAVVVEELKATSPRLQELLKELDLNERERNLALQLNDVQEASSRHLRSVQLLEDLIELIRKRLNDLMLGTGDPEDFSSSYGGITKESTAILKNFKMKKEELKTGIESDIETTKLGLLQEAAKDSEQAEAADESFKESMELLQKNVVQQDTLWNSMLESMDQMKKLGEDRASQVQAHIEMVEKEAKRRYVYADFVTAANLHLTNLHEALKHTEAAHQMACAVDNYFSQGFAKAKAKSVEEKLDQMKIKEMQQYCEVFRKYCLTAGDLVDRKEKRLNGINRLLKNLDFELSMATETLDGDREKYEKDSKEYRRRGEQLLKEILRLKASLEHATADFRVTEEQLEESGIDFVPPELELQEYMAEKKRNYLEKKRALLYDDQQELDRDSTEVRKLDSQVKTTADVTQERREILKTRRLKGSVARIPDISQEA